MDNLIVERISNIGKDKVVVIGIDGPACSGKSTCAKKLQKELGGVIIPMDSFFLPGLIINDHEDITPGSNIDYGRLLKEALLPGLKGEPITIKKYDCKRGEFQDPLVYKNENLLIVEGAYSHKEVLRKYYDLTIFLDISNEEQRKRLKIREDDYSFERFNKVWIPLENKYFLMEGIKEKADVVI